jgi:hypothetical protein
VIVERESPLVIGREADEEGSEAGRRLVDAQEARLAVARPPCADGRVRRHAPGPGAPRPAPTAGRPRCAPGDRTGGVPSFRLGAGPARRRSARRISALRIPDRARSESYRATAR